MQNPQQTPHKKSLTKFLTIGFVGARLFSNGSGALAWSESEISAKISDVINRIRGQLDANEELFAVSALALGADTLFAEIVARESILQEVILPQRPDMFFNADDFNQDLHALDRARNLLNSANVIEIRTASDSEDRGVRFAECTAEIVRECDVLIAVAKMNQPGRIGGTVEAINLARSLGKQVYAISLDDDLRIKESAGNIIHAHRHRQEIWRWRLVRDATDPAKADKSELDLLKDAASREAKLHQFRFRLMAKLMILSHVAATAVAAWALARLWGGQHLAFFKVALIGLGLFLYWRIHHMHPQKKWVVARATSEVCRSVLALRGFKTDLRFLRDYNLPGGSGLARTLHVLHLKELKTAAVSRQAFIHRYLKEHLGAQSKYYLSKAAEAKSQAKILDRSFLGFSLLSFVAAVGYWVLHPDPSIATSTEKLLFLFIPVVFPMIAAAAASWVAVLDLERRIDRYQEVARILSEYEARIRNAISDEALRRLVKRTERLLLQEVMEWQSTQAHMRGH